MAFGGQWIVQGGKDIAVYFARQVGYENAEGIVGLTVVAIGTSLPELIASVVAAIKGKTDLAIGNIFGSNTFNLLWVLGLSSAIKPLDMPGAFRFEMVLIVLSSLLIYVFIALSREAYLRKYQGYIMLILYAFYLGHLLKI